MIKTNILPDIYDKKKNKEEKLKKKIKKKKYYVHKETSNLSFLKMYKALEMLNVENNDFFLALYDKDLKDVDPFEDDLSDEIRIKILNECIANYWYFVREIVRIPVEGSDAGSGKRYQLHRGNLAIGWSITNNVNFFVELPRQNFKTVSIMIGMLWLYNFGTTNSNMMLIHKDHRGAKDNLATIKKIRDVLPEWMRFDKKFNEEQKELKVPQNVEYSFNHKTHNKIVTLPSATSKERADLLGRGATQAVQNFDEHGFLRFNKIIYEAAAPAAQQAAIEAEANGKYHCKMISTTPGDMSTEYGRDSYAFRGQCVPFTEDMYSWTKKEVEDYVETSENGFIRISFSYRQLGRSEKYFKDVSKGLSNFKIRREILLEWLVVNEDPIFNETSLNNLLEMAKERTCNTIWIEKKFKLDLYEKINPLDTYIVSCDCASSLGKDYSTLVITNTKTKAVVGELKTRIDTTTFSFIIYTVCTKVVKNCMIVIERNNVGASVITNLLKTDIKSKLYYENGSKEYQDKIKDGRTVESATDNRLYGVWTSEERKIQMHEILVKYVDNYPKRLATKLMAEEINNLVYNKKHQIDHPPDGHDDLVMGYLVGMWVYHYGKNLARYGIFKVPDIDPESGLTDEEALDQALAEQEERERNLQEAYQRLNNAVDYNSQLVEAAPLKTVNDYYDQMDKELNKKLDGGGGILEKNRNINDLMGNNNGSNNTNGRFTVNLFDSGIGNSGSDSFGNDLINNILNNDF